MLSELVSIYRVRLGIFTLMITFMCGCRSESSSRAELRVGAGTFVILASIDKMHIEEDGVVVLSEGCGDRLHEAISTDLFHGVPFEIHDSGKVVIKGSITSPYSSKRFTGPVLLLGDSLDRDNLNLQTDFP